MSNPGAPDSVHGWVVGGEDRRNYEFVIDNPINVSNNSNRQWQFRVDGDLKNCYVEFMVSITRVSDTTLIKDGAITTDKITVGSLNGDRISAGTVDANTIKAGTVLSNLVQVANTGFGSSFDLGAAVVAAQNPANRINALTTAIDPGKITIAGATTLANWRNGGDVTKIEGGAIAANTITANKLMIGNRGVSYLGLEFEYDVANQGVKWNAGFVYFTDSSGNRVTQYVNGGNAFGQGAPLWFNWRPGQTYIGVQQADPGQDDQVVLGSWWGGSRLNMNGGGTIINGDQITTGTIRADRLIANSITANQIAAYTITGDRLVANTITANQIASKTITADQIAANTITADQLSTNKLITQSSQIGDAVITNAKIANLSVDSLKIAGSAVGQRAIYITNASISIPYS